MITATEREAAFRKDFKKLLIKHGAMLELDVDYDIHNVSEYPSRPILEVIMCTVSGEVTRDVKREYTRFNLNLEE